MRKLLAALLTIAFVGSVASAATFTNIGYIDVQKVFKEYKATEKAQEELAKQEKDFKAEFEKSQEELAKAEKDGKSEEELNKMKTELEKKLMPKRDSLLKLNEQLTAKLQLEILDAVKKVAKKVGIDLVVDKQVVITGGMDLTEMVINELNK